MRIHRDLAGWGVFFVVAGGVPLAVQTGLIAPDVLDRWWSFWPLILVGIGLGLVFTRTSLELLGGLLVSGTLGLLVAGLMTGGFGRIGDLPSGVCGPGSGATAFTPQSGSLGPNAEVGVELDCGTVEIGTTEGADWIVEGVGDAGRGPVVKSDGLTLEIAPPDGSLGGFLGERDRWVLHLPTGSLLNLQLDINAGSVTADLDRARLGHLEVDLNAGQATIDLRDISAIDAIDIGLNAGALGLTLPAMSLTGSIEANAGSIRLCAPEGVALRLHTEESVLSSQDFAGAGLVRVGDTWETPGFDTAVTRIELDTSANAGSISLDPVEGCG